MKVNEIERLLTRYYDGETSETEEKELKRFFTEEDVPAHLLAEKEIFMQLAAQPAPEIPEGLESRLSRKIDQWDTGERRTLKIKKHTHLCSWKDKPFFLCVRRFTVTHEYSSPNFISASLTNFRMAF